MFTITGYGLQKASLTITKNRFGKHLAGVTIT